MTDTDQLNGTSWDRQWESAWSAVNAWRGECMQCLAHSETAVTETLMTLSAVPQRGLAVRLRHHIGQRFQDLADATGPEGPFGKDGEKLTIPLPIIANTSTSGRYFATA